MKRPFPEDWTHWAIAAIALFTVVGPLYMEARVSPLRPYDEGAVLTPAMMFGKEVRMQDFDPAHGPAEPGILYLLSDSSGPKLLHLRLLRYGGFALAAFFATLGAARLGGVMASPLAAMVVLLLATPLANPAFALALAGVVLAGLADDRSAQRRLLFAVAGLCAGMGILFRLSFGVLGCVAALVVILIQPAQTGGVSFSRERLARIAAFATGLAPSAVTLGALVASGRARLSAALNYEDLIAYRVLPFPFPVPAGTPVLMAIKTLVWACLPFLVLFVSLVFLLIQFRKRASLSSIDTHRLSLQVGLTLLLAGLVPYALIRPDLPHFSPLLVVSSCLGAGLLSKPGRFLPDRVRSLVTVCLLIVFGAVSASQLRDAAAIRGSPDRIESALAPLRGLFVERRLETYYSEASQLVRSLTRPDDTLYLGSLDHRRILMNDTLLYAISGRRPATRHTCFNPGDTTTEARQREMIRDLVVNKPPVAFLVPSWRREPNQSRELGSDLLDRFLRRNYRLHSKVGPSRLLVRREYPVPPGYDR